MWNLRDILSILFKRKVVIIAFFLAVCVGTFVVLKVTAPNYEATAKLLLKVGREDIYVPALPSETLTRPMMSLIREEQLNSEAEIITSEYLVEKLVDEMGVDGIYPSMLVTHPWYTPKGMMQAAISAYRALEGFFIPLSTNLTPEQRAMKRLLKKDIVAEGTGSSNVIAVTVRNKIPDLAAKTANSLVDLYLSERGRIHAADGGSVFEQQMRENEKRLDEAQRKLQDFREENGLTDVANGREDSLQRIAEIRSVITDLKSKPSEAKRLVTWQAELKKVEGQLHTLGDVGLQYVRLQQDVDVLTSSRKVFLEKLEEYRINEALNSARIGNVTVISQAVPPTAPSNRKLWLILAAMLFAGLAGGVGLAFLFELMDDTLETNYDVKKRLGVPVLGKIA